MERVRKLEREGVIESYHAKINPAKLGANLMVFVEITLTRTSADAFAEFSEAARKTEEILECHLVAGDFDFLINHGLAKTTPAIIATSISRKNQKIFKTTIEKALKILSKKEVEKSPTLIIYGPLNTSLIKHD